MKSKEFTTEVGQKWLKELLSDGEVLITFIKTDGTERVMKCTLNNELISENVTVTPKEPKTTTRKVSDEVLPVFDLENKGWRSFRWDSITYVNFSL